MEYEIVWRGPIHVVGIALHASNSRPAEIGAHWQRFWAEGVPGRVANKAREEVVSLYTGYEGDHSQPYKLVAGCPVTSLDEIPDGMEGHTIPSARYARLVAKGAMPAAVVGVWQWVWSSDLDRAYTSDFDLYGPAALDPMNAEAEIFVAVK
ncbi:MAG: GyrI-like domain-containing protein [Pseudomonadota bacterium]